MFITAYLSSRIIVEVGAAMVISLVLKSGQILFPASFVVLTNCFEGVASSCDDNKPTQVDGTGVTEIKMLVVNNLSYLVITK